MNTFFLNLGAIKDTHHAKYNYKKVLVFEILQLEITAYSEIVIVELLSTMISVDDDFSIGKYKVNCCTEDICKTSHFRVQSAISIINTILMYQMAFLQLRYTGCKKPMGHE